MTKEELIKKMAASAGISKIAASAALEAFTSAVTVSLKRGRRVTLIDFGSFSITKRKARIGRNPRTGKDSHIPAASVPKFSAGEKLRSAIGTEPHGPGGGRPLPKK